MTREFKIEAAKHATETGHGQRRVASDPGFHPNTINKWVRQYSEWPQDAFPGKGLPLTGAATLRQLQSENGWLRMERDILTR